ncbi:DUF389 domain-containing protein [Streptobacillus canis]|uniref:DUF389 domain-containing protein n=1 Tax=Streptobacillus canis TaxID=2678686 RepID=UPI0012E25BA8|nr:DUF389 domain-containing protein [Streptobacillus canis]
MNSKQYTLIEFRDKMYQNLEVTASSTIILMCAIFIASIGLNMNSIPVIIGAMLISPLMNSILGMGVGLSIYDMVLVKKSLRLMSVQVGVSLFTSFIYFSISPITYASSEIIARTSPTIWDVIIAFVGGIAGIIGARQKEVSNIIPGVAIATALMPPVCTAGYSLATGNFEYFFGASYLFLINTCFIMIATFIGIRFMYRGYSEIQENKKLKKILLTISFLIIIPSIFSAAKLVTQTVRTDAVEKMIEKEFTSHVIINKKFVFKDNKVELTIAGDLINNEDMKKILNKRKEYGLENIEFEIFQIPNVRNLNPKILEVYIDKYIEKKLNNK